MMTKITTKMLGLTAATALVLGAGAAHAEEGVAIKRMLGNIGLIAPEKDTIRYRERAPLVLPPRADLPPPTPKESYASNNPQWPNDPDVAAKKRESASALIPTTLSETRRMSENNPRLSVDEIRAGRRLDGQGNVPGTNRGDNARDVLMLTPDQMRGAAKPDDDGKSAAAEPARATLADPPGGYRKQRQVASTGATPRIDQQTVDASPMAWLTRKFQSSDDE